MRSIILTVGKFYLALESTERCSECRVQSAAGGRQKGGCENQKLGSCSINNLLTK